MKTLSEFRASVEDHIGELASLLKAGQVERWVNEGQARLNLEQRLSIETTLPSGSTDFELPDDFKALEALFPHSDPTYTLPPHFRVWGHTAYFAETTDNTGARILYRADFPKITEAQASLLPALADEALVSFCLYRFFKRLVANRADFRRYSVLTGASGVGMEELDSISEQHLQDFESVREALVEDLESTVFYGE